MTGTRPHSITNMYHNNVIVRSGLLVTENSYSNINCNEINNSSHEYHVKISLVINTEVP